MSDKGKDNTKPSIMEMKSYLESEGFDTWLDSFEDSGGTIECLCLTLPDEEQSAEKVVQFIFLPIEGMELLSNVECLQAIFSLPIYLNENTIEATAAALDVLNNMLLAGHLGIFEDGIIYRYSYFVPKLDGVVLGCKHYIDHIIFLLTTVVAFTALIENINDDKMSMDDFLNALENIQAVGRKARLE